METTMAKTVEKITLFFKNIYLVDDADLQLKPPRNNVCYNVVIYLEFAYCQQVSISLDMSTL